MMQYLNIHIKGTNRKKKKFQISHDDDKPGLSVNNEEFLSIMN